MNAKKRGPSQVTTPSEFPRCRKKNKEGRHVGLDFYDLLIEAHPVLISDDWRQSGPQDKDGALGVQESIVDPTSTCGSKRTDPFGSGDAVCATTVPAIVLGTLQGCRGFLVPHSS